MDADVLCVRQPDGQPWTVPDGLTFRDWLHDTGQPGRPGQPGRHRPTDDDLNYHLSTLFPPVRARGHLELRMIDAQPDDGWIVPVALISALIDDPIAADAAMAASEPVWHQPVPLPRTARTRERVNSGQREVGPWLRAARYGPADPAIAKATLACFEAAEAALARSGAPEPIKATVADFAERYLARGRCPADDILDVIANPEGQS